MILLLNFGYVHMSPNNDDLIVSTQFDNLSVDYDKLAGINSIYTISSSPYAMDNSGTMSITGENADITLNGKSMRDWMSKVEERLAIFEPNAKLEAEWAELKELGEQYKAKEREIKEKARAWNILKD